MVRLSSPFNCLILFFFTMMKKYAFVFTILFSMILLQRYTQANSEWVIGLSSDQRKQPQKALQAISKFEFKAFPNPFINATKFKIVPGEKKPTFLQVTNVLGTTITNIKISDFGNPSSYILDLTDYNPGIYICTLYQNKEVLENIRLVKIR